MFDNLVGTETSGEHGAVACHRPAWQSGPSEFLQQRGHSPDEANLFGIGCSMLNATHLQKRGDTPCFLPHS